MDKISVIVPIYNQEKYLDECIQSIIDQTYKNLEIILVDDGSTDNSLEICKKYEKIDKRIKLIHKENGGLSSARNCGLDSASGKYVMFCDSDDYFVPRSCEILLNLIKSKNANYAIGNYINCTEEGVLWEKPTFDQDIYHDFKVSIKDYDKSFYIMSSSVCNKIFSIDFIKKHKLRFVEGVPAEDAIFTTFCFIKSKYTYYTSEIMYIYRQRNGTSISTNNTLKYFMGISKAYKYIYDNFKANNELDFYKYFYLKTLFYILFKFIDSTVMNYEDRLDALKELQWFTKLYKKLKIKTNNNEFFDIIKLVNNGSFSLAIDKCMEIAKKRVGMSDEDKLKMSKIPPSEYHCYIEKEV